MAKLAQYLWRPFEIWRVDLNHIVSLQSGHPSVKLAKAETSGTPHSQFPVRLGIWSDLCFGTKMVFARYTVTFATNGFISV